MNLVSRRPIILTQIDVCIICLLKREWASPTTSSWDHRKVSPHLLLETAFFQSIHPFRIIEAYHDFRSESHTNRYSPILQLCRWQSCRWFNDCNHTTCVEEGNERAEQTTHVFNETHDIRFLPLEVTLHQYSSDSCCCCCSSPYSLYTVTLLLMWYASTL